jgi:hypothetical protein
MVVLTFILQKLITIILGFSAIEYKDNNSQKFTQNSAITAFELQIGHSNTAFVATFNNRGDGVNMTKFQTNCRTRLRHISFNFSE